MDDDDDCPLFNGTVAYCNAIYGVKKSFASLSLVGCVFMFSVIYIFKKYELFVQRLILYLTMAAFFQSSSSFLVGPRLDSVVCTFEACWISFWNWAVLLWVSSITFNLYLIIIWMANPGRREIIYHLVTWGLSLFGACLPLIGNHYGPAGAWCWIPAEYPVWRFFIWYGPLFILILLMFVTYAYISYKLRDKIRSWQGTYDPQIERSRQLIREEIKPLRAYPFIYLILAIFPLINRIQNAISPNNPIFALYFLHAMSSPLVGLVNAIVYGLDPETRSRLTWKEIKVAVSTHRAKKARIQKYDVSPNDLPQPPSPEDVALTADDQPTSPSPLSINADVHLDSDLRSKQQDNNAKVTELDDFDEVNITC